MIFKVSTEIGRTPTRNIGDPTTTSAMLVMLAPNFMCCHDIVLKEHGRPMCQSVQANANTS